MDDCWGGGSVVVAVTVAVEVDVTVVVPVTIVINCVGALLILIVIPPFIFMIVLDSMKVLMLTWNW